MAAGYTEDQVKLATIFHDLQKISEAATDMYSLVDFSDAVTFDKQGSVQSSGVLFNYTMAYSQALQRPSATATCYLNEGQLRMLRARSRAFCALSPYWMAVRENRINYAIGTGHVISVVPRKRDTSVPAELREKIEDELEKFTKINQYRHVQGEKLTRGDRDGEFFLRFFDNKPDKILRVRFVEPLLVQDPPGTGPEGDVWFGIEFDGQDYEEPLRYFVRPSTYDGGMTSAMNAQWRRGIPASQIQHRKFNVDKNSPRGLPSTYSVQESCTQALSTLRSMGRLVDVRARIALIRKQVNATLGQITPLLNAQRAGRIVKSDGSYANAFNYSYGSIIDTNDQRSLEFPSQHIETDKIVHSLKADLQSVAAAMGLADFTISGDSSAAFANALVKEGPMDRAMGRVQKDMIDDDLQVYERALQVAIEDGRLPADTLDKIRIDILPPTVIARDRLVNTQADEILVRNGAMSPDTMAMRSNLDPDDEREKIKQNPSPEMELAKMKAQGLGNARSNQPGMAGKTNARGVPAGKEPGPGANKTASSSEEVEEGSYEPHSHEPPPQAHQDMASAILPPEWVDRTKREIAGLPLNGGCPRDNGIRMEYEPGIFGILLGIVDEQKIWAVDASAVMILHDSPDFVVAGNHMRWPWIPADVVLVDWSYSPCDMAHDILHEVAETRLMAQGRWPYAMAHRVANAMEREYLLALRPDLRSLVPS